MTEDPAQQGSAIDRIRNDPALRTRDDSGLWAITIGTLAWLIAVGVFAIFGDNFTGIDATRALQVSIAGFLLGVLGVVIVGRRHRRMKTRQT
jgi:hypothetical protein